MPDRFRKFAQVTPEGRQTCISFKCPACNGEHAVPVTGKAGWSWNGSLSRPSLQPSIRAWRTDGDAHVKFVCHSTITHGRISFETDCTHQLGGQQFELEEYPPPAESTAAPSAPEAK